MDFFMCVIFPVLVIVLLVCIVPKIRKAIQKDNEYNSFKTFLEENNMYDTVYKSATYKNIVEMAFDKENKRLGLYSYYEDVSIIVDFTEILDFEVSENGNSIISSRAMNTLSGGVFFGDLGAMVGMSGSRTVDEVCKELKLKIYTKDVENSVITLDFLDDDIYTVSEKYQQISRVIDEMVGFLKIIKESNRQNEREEIETVDNTKEMKQNNSINDLEKLAELKAKGIITQEEFEESKKKILGRL